MLFTSLLRKGGPYIGPKGGKWADPKHTIPWAGAKEKATDHSAKAAEYKRRRAAHAKPYSPAGQHLKAMAEHHKDMASYNKLKKLAAQPDKQLRRLSGHSSVEAFRKQLLKRADAHKRAATLLAASAAYHKRRAKGSK